MPVKSLLKALTEAGTGPRRRMAEAIKQGKVAVNGEIAESFTQPVNTESDCVTINGKAIELKPDETICLMLHKPASVVSTASDEKGRRTALDLLPDRYKKYRLYPVGRLDIDTTGLLLLTNDGDLTYRLTHPKFEHEKEYLLQIKKKLNIKDKSILERGVRLEDGLTHPARVKEVSLDPFNYSITIHEGRKRQVHRMFEKLGHPLLALKRVRVGNLRLGNLQEGKVRRLSTAETRALLGDRPGKSGKQPDDHVDNRRNQR
jgi:23S rRNA pseudouridine2605 synthase